MNIAVMGSQGSGKSTQAKLLAESLNLLHVSSGQILREMYELGTDKGKEAYEYWGKGQLVPHDLIDEVIEEWLEKIDYHDQGVVTDGYPRTLADLETLDRNGLWGSLDRVVFLCLDESTVIERMMKRREIEHRLDETPEAIKKRLQEYHEKTAPLLDIFRERGILIEVDGSPSIGKIQEEILKKLK